MTVAVSLLRAINLGPKNQVRMEALSALHEELGLTDVKTYVNSGNVVFRTKLRDVKALERKLEDAIERHHGFRPPVIIRTAEELRDAVARNPFAGRKGIEPAKLHVVFLAGRPDAAAAERIRGIKVGPEEAYLSGRELYVYYPDGAGRSKFTAALIDKSLSTTGTARNWNTVTKLLEMAEALVG
jgi:uncharacterized protein (DUF1697 family)